MRTELRVQTHTTYDYGDLLQREYRVVLWAFPKNFGFPQVTQVQHPTEHYTTLEAAKAAAKVHWGYLQSAYRAGGKPGLFVNLEEQARATSTDLNPRGAV